MDLHLRKLVPVDDADIEVYEDALDFALAEDDVYNVSVVGPYGAGKSSIIRSYFKSRNREHEVQTISLAHFGVPEAASNKGESLTKHLEGEIIGQLVLTLTEDTIRFSRFSRPVRANKERILRNICAVAVFVALCLLVNFLTDGDGGLRLYGEGRYVIAGLCTVMALVLASYLAFEAYLGYRKRGGLKRVTAANCSFEVFDESEDSFFDRHLGEIIYLFEESGFSIYVFEDLDRYDNIHIFEQLRKVNNLLNERADGKKSFKFFYLVSDRMLTCRDRTKFFDLIIPVIPYVESDNSYDLILQRLQAAGISIDDRFLSRMSMYIDEMRLLDSICNECSIYWHKIGKASQLDQTKLFAFIVYKNLYPLDYDQLCQGNGTLRYVLERKRIHIAKKAREQMICQLKAEGENPPSEQDGAVLLSRLRELEYMTDDEFSQNYSLKQTVLNSTQASEVLEDLVIRNLAASGCLSVGRGIEGDSAIENPLKQINDGDDQDSAVIKVSLADEFSVYKSELLCMLLKNGYIDETYHDYLSYFHEGRHSRSDKTFIRHVIEGTPLSFGYRLSNPTDVLQSLTGNDLSRSVALNYDLVCHAIKSRDVESLGYLVDVIIREQRLDFVVGLFNSSEIDAIESSIKLAMQINDRSRGAFLRYVLLDSAHPHDDAIAVYVCLTVWGVSNGAKTNPEDDKAIADYCVSNQGILNRLSERQEDFTGALSYLHKCGVRLDDVGQLNLGSWAVEAIYNESLFSFSPENIELFGSRFWHEGYGWERGVDALLLNRSTVLYQCIIQNLNAFVLLICEREQSIKGREESLRFVLDSEDITDEAKRSYVDKHRPIKVDIVDFTSDSGVLLLAEKQMIKSNMGSVVRLLMIEDDLAIRTVPKLCDDLEKDDDWAHWDDEAIVQTMERLVAIPGLSPQGFSEVLFATSYRYTTFRSQGVSTEIISALAKSGRCDISEENLQFLRRWYPDNVTEFLVWQPEKYAEYLSRGGSCYETEYLGVVASDVVDDAIKLNVIDQISGPISLKRLSLGSDSERLVTAILAEHFDISDVSYCMTRYESWQGPLQKTFYERLIEVIQEEDFAPMDCPPALLARICRERVLPVSKICSLLAYNMPSMEFTEFVVTLRDAVHPDLNGIYYAISDGKRPMVTNSRGVLELLSLLQTRGLISSYQIEESAIRVYGRKGGAFHLPSRFKTA